MELNPNRVILFGVYFYVIHLKKIESEGSSIIRGRINPLVSIRVLKKFITKLFYIHIVFLKNILRNSQVNTWPWGHDDIQLTKVR